MEKSKQKYSQLPAIKDEEFIEIVRGFKSKMVLGESMY